MESDQGIYQKNHGEAEKLEYLKRIEKAVDSGKHVVFACGEVVEDYLGTSRKNGEVEILFTSSGTPYFLVHGTHPSWHLTSGGRDVAKKIFKRDMALVRVVNKMSATEAALLNKNVLSAMINEQLGEQHQKYLQGTKRVQEALLGEERKIGEWWPSEFKHLRLQDWSSEGVVSKFLRFIARSTQHARLFFKFNSVPKYVAANNEIA